MFRALASIAIGGIPVFLQPLHAAQPEKRAPETGKIVVYRIWKFAGAGRSLPVILDNRPRIKLENGYYYVFTVPAGNHLLVRTSDFGMKDKIAVHVDPEQTVYVDAHYGDWSGPIFEVADDQKEAKQRAATLKEQTFTH